MAPQRLRLHRQRRSRRTAILLVLLVRTGLVPSVPIPSIWVGPPEKWLQLAIPKARFRIVCTIQMLIFQALANILRTWQARARGPPTGLTQTEGEQYAAPERGRNVIGADGSHPRRPSVLGLSLCCRRALARKGRTTLGFDARAKEDSHDLVAQRKTFAAAGK